MSSDYIIKLLEEVKAGKTDVDMAYEQLKELPYKDMGFANIDHHRRLRNGFAEVVYCEGKTSQQICDIMVELNKNGETVMGTRASETDYECVKKAISDAIYYEKARIIAVKGRDANIENDELNILGNGDDNNESGIVAVVSAGTADIPVAEEAAVTAEILGNKVHRIYDVGVAGIHRLFDKLDIIREADVVIAVAGMEGALASVIGGLVEAPVIAVPTSIGYGANLGGISALLSMLNSCANGVAVVNIDNGFGAAYMASVINKKMMDNSRLQVYNTKL